MQLEITELEKLFPTMTLKFNIRDPRSKDLPFFYVSLGNTHIKIREILQSAYENGNTVDEALSALAASVSKQTLVDDYVGTRKEYKLPEVVHTKLLNR